MTLYPTPPKIQERRLVLNPRTGRLEEKPQGRPFIKGPIPLDWLAVAAILPGKALHVAIAIWWLKGMQQPGTQIKVTRTALERLRVSKDAANDGLKRLEDAGLITVQRRPGQLHAVKVVATGQ